MVIIMNNVYLIYGSDYSLVKKEIDKIIKYKKDVVKYDLNEDTLDNAIDDASFMSMFEDTKVVIVQSCEFLTSNDSKMDINTNYLLNYINSDNKNILILTVISDKLDERKKVVKEIKQKTNVIYKNSIDEKKLGNYVVDEFKQRGYVISPKDANYFIEYVGKNIDIIQSEIEKMIIYKDDKIITTADINSISSKGFKDNIFDFTDAIVKKDYKKMFECYDDLIKIGEEPIKIISLLGNQFILIYQVKKYDELYKSQSEIASILKIHPYRVKLALESDFLISELESIIKKLHELDYEIKSGLIDKKVGLKDFLLRL